MSNKLILEIIYGVVFFLICTDVIMIIMAHFLKKKDEEYLKQLRIKQQNYWMKVINEDPELTYINPRAPGPVR